MAHLDDDADEDWQDDESDDGYTACPHCGATMLEDAEYCPACDRWMTSEVVPAKRPSWLIIAVAFALIALMILSLVV